MVGEPKGASVALQRKCPACGVVLEPKVRICPECGASYRAASAAAKELRDADQAGHGLEARALRKGIAGGLAMMAVAVVWFVVGWMAGWAFFYPPILFIIGLFGVIKGLVEGNVAGKKPPVRRPGREPR